MRPRKSELLRYRYTSPAYVDFKKQSNKQTLAYIEEIILNVLVMGMNLECRLCPFR